MARRIQQFYIADNKPASNSARDLFEYCLEKAKEKDLFSEAYMHNQKPRRFMPGLYVQYVNFRGNDVTSEVINEMQLEGNYCEMLPRLESFLEMSVPSLSQALSQVLSQALSQVCPKLLLDNCDSAIIAIFMVKDKPLPIISLMEAVEEKNRSRYRQNILKPLMDGDIIEQTIKDIPNSPKQKYALTNKGKDLLNKIAEGTKN